MLYLLEVGGVFLKDRLISLFRRAGRLLGCFLFYYCVSDDHFEQQNVRNDWKQLL